MLLIVKLEKHIKEDSDDCDECGKRAKMTMQLFNGECQCVFICLDCLKKGLEFAERHNHENDY